MPKIKHKILPPQLEFVNPPYSKNKGEFNFKNCSEIYPQVKKTHPEEAYHWVCKIVIYYFLQFDPSFKVFTKHSTFKLERSLSVPKSHIKKLEFVEENNGLRRVC